MTVAAVGIEGWNGLAETRKTLESASYRDAGHFQRDLDAVWYRNWVCVARSQEVAAPLAFRTFSIGTQELIAIRDADGRLRAFHNTCRHRGAPLRREAEGRLASRLITCPYHNWSYALDGTLRRVPSQVCPAGFDRVDYLLYAVAVEEWRGFVFVNLDPTPATGVAESFDAGSADLGNWPLEELKVGHTHRRVLACNWKVVWENYNECLHCAHVHPELSALVPIYGRGFMSRNDDPDWARHAADEAPAFSGGLRAGAETWSADGCASGPTFPGLTAAERSAGQSYATCLPSIFLVGHVDYVRSVRLLPLGPERTELVAEWLFLPEQLASQAFDLENIVSFGRLVLEQDAEICELNQRGLRSLRHRTGVLMPEEYEIARFHDWVRGQHEDAGATRAGEGG